MKQVIIVLAAILVAVSGQIVIDGQCANNETLVNNFNLTKYAGLWYETYRYDQDFQFSGECVTATYTLMNDAVNVFNSMVLNGVRYTINGTAILAPDANGRGKLLVNFPSTGTRLGDYWVLSTDYTNYSLVFACDNITSSTKKISSWLLSRKSTLSPQSVLAINESLKVVDGLSWDKYRFTNHTESLCKA